MIGKLERVPLREVWVHEARDDAARRIRRGQLSPVPSPVHSRPGALTSYPNDGAVTG